MDAVYSNNSKISELNSLNDNVSPINTQMNHHSLIGKGRFNPQSKSPTFNVHSLENLNPDFPLMKYVRSNSPVAGKFTATGDLFPSPAIKYQYSSNSSSSGKSGFGSRGGSLSVSPLSAVENVEKTPPLYVTPVKAMEEDVLVMDGILVGSVLGGRVLRSGSDSGGGSSSSSSGNNMYKTEICRAWEDFGNCRYGSKCLFAHGKEELRPTPYPVIKNKSETQLCKSYTNTGSCIYGHKCRFVHQIMTEATAATAQTVSPTNPEYTSHTSYSTIKHEHASMAPATTNPEHTTSINPEDRSKMTPATSSDDWSPLDDGIEVVLPSHADKSPSREEIDAHIHGVLYGPTGRRRLSVFTEICSE